MGPLQASTLALGADGQEYPTINNSTQFQVYIPGAYDSSLPPHADIGPAVSDTEGQFLQYIIGESRAIDAEFGADMELVTGDGDLVSAPYLKGIEDPIGKSCFVNVSGSHNYGMSQRGAIRWAKGNECPDESGAAWSVKWNHQQILTHYYRGIDIIDDATGNKVVPDDRWNLISHDIPLDANRIGNANAGQTLVFNIKLQNTSTSDWTDNTIIGYQWTPKGAAATGQWNNFSVSVPPINKGTPLTSLDLAITVPSDYVTGDYTLHLDPYRNGHWLSEQSLPWSDATIDIHVNGPTATSTPVATQSSTPTPASSSALLRWVSLSASSSGVDGATPHSNTYTSSALEGNDLWFKATGSGHCDAGNGTQSVGCSVLPSAVRVKNISSHKVTLNWLLTTTSSHPNNIVSRASYGGNSGVFPQNVNLTDASYVSHLDPNGETTVDVAMAVFNSNAPMPANANFLADVYIRVSATCESDWLNPCPKIEDPNTQQIRASNDFSSISQIQEVLVDVQLYYRVRDELLALTAQGSHFTDLHYQHELEIGTLLWADAELYQEGMGLLQQWEPKLDALLVGQGNTVLISQEEVDAVESFLLNLGAVASNDLKSVLQNERADLNMQGLVGQTMSQAWDEINGVAAATPTNTPTNISTPTNTPTFTPTNTPTNTPTLTLTFTPTFTSTNAPAQTSTLTNTPTATATPSQTFTPTLTPAQASQPLYLSLNNAGTVGSVSAQDVDILSFSGSTWSMFFDGSDVGISTTDQDMNEFHILDADSILMTFDEPITLGALTADLWDVVQFDATSLGDNTAGTFSMYLDGNDVGLDTTNEYIDGLDVLSDGRVLISTTGSPSVSGVTGAVDEDILAFTPTTLGDVTSGTWSMYFDGSDVGLADSGDEDVDALAVHSNGDIYLSTSGNFTVTGISGLDEDVFICAPTSLGTVTACNYSTSLYFDGSAYGLDANDVDGIDLTLP